MSGAVVREISRPRMSLDAVVKGKIKKPVRVLLYGVEGVGKSTFAAGAPSPIFIGAEDGTSELDVARFPEPQSWNDVIDAVEVLRTGQHSYKTVVIDTLDWLEPKLHSFVCQNRPDKNGARHSSIDNYPYGQGIGLVVTEWRALLAALDALRAQRGMNVILLAHSTIKPFKNPTEDDYDRFELALLTKSAGVLKQWPDAVLFATFETLVRKVNGTSKGVSTGARIVHTERRAAWDAKNRFYLPETIPLDWAAFEEGVAAHQPKPTGAIMASIDNLLIGADEDLAARVRAAVAAANGDGSKLSRIENKLRAVVSAKENA